jgi:hypothetical protein
MSEVISHIAEPLMEEYADTQEDMEKIISLTIAAWNLELLPEGERERERVSVAKRLFRRRLFGLIPMGPDQDSLQLFCQVCEVVSRRKQQLYPHLHHLILDVRFQPVESGVYFEVIYGVA